MTRKEALAELIGKVEAGDDFGIVPKAQACLGAFDPNYGVGEIACRAFGGSLDASKALHEAVLPEWDWCITPHGASVYSPHDNNPTDGDLDNSARAWLLAILKALYSMEKD